MHATFLASIHKRFRTSPPLAFTLLELLVIMAILGFLGAVLATGFASTHSAGQSVQCLNSLRQLTRAWGQYSEDNKELLLTCQNVSSPFVIAGRTNWMEGNLDFSPIQGNWDPRVYVYTSPMFRYCGKDPLVFRCPADKSTVIAGDGSPRPRVRSRSMNSAFARGDWLDKNYNNFQTAWRLYRSFSDIVRPANTFVFIDEHPDSVNDSVLSSACTGNQPTDPTFASQIIDFPANYHNGGSGISFADGHVEIHKWIGTKVARAPITYTGTLALNVTAGDSWIDMHWLAENTTVRN